jgi:GT2 family glycosyltransferase
VTRVAAVVLNWNNTLETEACLRSLETTRNCALSVLVVDNGSTDDSIASIRAVYPSVELIETGGNLGYAGGNNIGIQSALAEDADYVFLINNDARVDEDTLERLVHAAEAHPDAAFLGPCIYHLDQPDEIQSCGTDLDFLWRSRHRTELPGDPSSRVVDVPCLSGAALLLRVSALEPIGLLDASLFMYREDVDWCLRASRMGYRIVCVPGASVWHRRHSPGENDLPRITYYMTRNSLMLLSKHAAGPLRLGLLLARYYVTVVSWTVRPRWRHKQAQRDALLQGIHDFFRGRSGYGFA